MAIVRWTPARDMLILRDQLDRPMDSAWGDSRGTQSSKQCGVAAIEVLALARRGTRPAARGPPLPVRPL